MTALEAPGLERQAERARRRVVLPFRRAGAFAYRYPLGALGASIIVVFMVLALFAPILAPYDARRSIALPLLAPSTDHLLGTDANGRDVLSRVLVGSQISLAVGFSVVLINVTLSTLLGLMAGYYQGVTDYIIQRSGEIWSAFPGLIALLLIVSILGAPATEGGNLLTIAWDMRNLIFAFSLGAVFGGSRLVRGVTLSLKNQDYVLAARSLGATGPHIVRRHLLPNVMPYVIVSATAGLGVVILAEAALSFLGLGVAPGTPSWGQDLSGRNRQFFDEALWVALAPGTAITLTVLGFNLFGDALRDMLDPRMRGSGRRRIRSDVADG
ncbi:MAG: ABC transporter permease subunit [Dehalococcoidia bacterium]|nr:ABC transporter permease subunit [Dehalococcoidia bacterium]